MTDRDRLIDILVKHWADGMTMGQCADLLLANGVIVQKQGKWQDNHNGTFACSVCGSKASRMNYCGNCGAKLKECEG